MQGQPAAAPTMAVNMASPQPAAASSPMGLGAKGDLIAELEALKLLEGGSHQRWSNYLNVVVWWKVRMCLLHHWQLQGLHHRQLQGRL